MRCLVRGSHRSTLGYAPRFKPRYKYHLISISGVSIEIKRPAEPIEAEKREGAVAWLSSSRQLPLPLYILTAT